jgi:dTDP-4-amino-4,6-dideoxygalactose transaminase
MEFKDFNRRNFIAAVTTTTVATAFSSIFPAIGSTKTASGKLALLGGTPIRAKVWPKWPAMLADDKMMESIIKTTKSGIWSRIQSPTGTVATFEKEYARLTGTNFCVGTGSGTQALSTCVEALGLGPGDEVITSPYSDFGTVSAILTSRALPVLADLDRESFQMDPDEVEKRINKIS